MSPRTETAQPYGKSSIPTADFATGQQRSTRVQRGGVEFVGVNGASRRQFDPRWNDYSPRFGFAFQVDQKNSVAWSVWHLLWSIPALGGGHHW